MLAWSPMVRHTAYVKQNPPLNSFVGVLTLLGYIVPVPPSRKEAPEIWNVSERSGWIGARLARASVAKGPSKAFISLLSNKTLHCILLSRFLTHAHPRSTQTRKPFNYFWHVAFLIPTDNPLGYWWRKKYCNLFKIRKKMSQLLHWFSCYFQVQIAF